MGIKEARFAKSTVLRLRGLPFQSTESDVENFFEGYKIKHCVVLRRYGRGTGEAYVQVDTPESASKALSELHCKFLGKRYIELFEAVESDMTDHAAIESDGMKGFVLRLRGLPYSTMPADIVRFFDGIDIHKSNNSIVLTVTAKGRPTGEAYVEFLNEENQQEAMTKHRQHMGDRYIELFKASKADLLQALKQNQFFKEQAYKNHLLLSSSFSEAMKGPQYLQSVQPYSCHSMKGVASTFKDGSPSAQGGMASMLLFPPPLPYTDQLRYDVQSQPVHHPRAMINPPQYWSMGQSVSQYQQTATVPARGPEQSHGNPWPGPRTAPRQDLICTQPNPYVMPSPLPRQPQQMKAPPEGHTAADIQRPRYAANSFAAARAKNPSGHMK